MGFLGGIFERIGVQPFQLIATRWQTATASHGIPWTTFSDQIGITGKADMEWVVRKKIRSHKYFLCANLIVQPFAPIVLGHPGLILHPPNLLMPFEDSGIPFHVFSAASGDEPLHYRGVYQDTGYSCVEFDWDQMDVDVMPPFLSCSHTRNLTLLF